MCGGFVVAYSSAKIDTEVSSFVQFLLHLNYNLGRILSYVVLGVAFGFLGQSVNFSRDLSGYIYFVVGILMVLIGISMAGKLKFLTQIESSLVFNPKIRQLFSILIKSKSKSSFFFLGVLNGFLPCGLVYFFLVSAVATGNWFWGGVTMLIFGLSTIPAMLGFGYMIGFLKSTEFRELMVKIASIVIIFYGIYLSYLGFMATQNI